MTLNLESPFFSILVLIGGVFTIAAMLMYLFPPKKINSLYGYRTSSSMKSIERWTFAQRFSSILMVKSGLVLMAISIGGLFVSVSKTVDTIAAAVCVIIAIALLILRTESRLKEFP